MNDDLISRSALLAVPNVCKVTEYDESGCGISYNAVPVEAIKAAPVVDAAPQWISVDERLPEDDGHYLCYTTDGYYNFCVYYGDGEWMILDQEDLAQNVTHWMPLPEPPKMDGDSP